MMVTSIWSNSTPCVTKVTSYDTSNSNFLGVRLCIHENILVIQRLLL